MMCEQGELIELDFNPTFGHGPAMRRPALVVSDGYFNNALSSLTVVCPITPIANGHPLHVAIAEGNPVGGCVCLEQIRALDLSAPARSAKKLGAFLDEATMTRVLDGLGAIFGI